MVNFDSDQLLTSNKGEILNLIILERSNDCIDSFKAWFKSSISNGSDLINKSYALRSSLLSFFMEIEIPLERKIKDKQDFQELKEFIYSTKPAKEEELIKAYDILNKFLDEINLTKIDTKKNFDSRLVEDENREKGL